MKKIKGDMPHSLEAEQAFLGCLLLDTKVQSEFVATTSQEDFYSESHQIIFGAMQEINRQNQPIDLVTLTDALEKSGSLEQAGGIAYITALTDVMPSTANYMHYRDIILRDSMLRKLIKGSSEIIEDCKSSLDEKVSLAKAEKIVYDISHSADTSETAKISAVLPIVMAKLDEISKDKNKASGVKTGYTSFDRLTNGLHPSDLIVLAARPSVGKTSFAMNIVENVAMAGKTCMVFSLEMNKEQLTTRMLASVAGVNMAKISRGDMDKADWVKVLKAREKLSKCDIHIDELGAISPAEMISKCRRIKSKYGLDLIMIDYIQLMQPSKKAESRQQEVSNISRELKIMAKELNVPVIALSQLSRSSEKEKRAPNLSDLRDSGAIEQDADIVMFIHRPDKGATDKEKAEGKYQQNVAEIRVEKHRSGATGMFKLYFHGECTKFLEMDAETGEPIGIEKSKKVDAVKIEGIEPIPEEETNSKQETDVEDDVFG
ncbi:MAG: replicative DNA helicase [Clostridia bacterium]|nr:replicative DNA helicase [Clostridia bacterium]